MQTVRCFCGVLVTKISVLCEVWFAGANSVVHGAVRGAVGCIQAGA